MLDTIAKKFQDMAAGVGLAAPSRDALARELAGLEAAPPGYFIDVHAPVAAVEHPTCEGCRAAGQEAAERRARYMAHASRVDILKAQLFRLSCGGADELDAPGRALTILRAEIRRARDEHERRRWGDLDEEPDPARPDRTITTWVAPAVLAEISKDLGAVYGFVADRLTYASTAEVEAGIVEARRRLAQILARPIRVPIDRAVAERANVPRHDFMDDTHGLAPSPTDPGVLAGTVRFKRRG